MFLNDGIKPVKNISKILFRGFLPPVVHLSVNCKLIGFRCVYVKNVVLANNLFSASLMNLDGKLSS